MQHYKWASDRHRRPAGMSQRMGRRDCRRVTMPEASTQKECALVKSFELFFPTRTTSVFKYIYRANHLIEKMSYIHLLSLMLSGNLN